MSLVATTTGTFLAPPPNDVPPLGVRARSRFSPNARAARKIPKIKRIRLLFGFTSVANRLTS
jgi:hypothetical protein